MFSKLLRSKSSSSAPTGQPLELVRYDAEARRFQVGADALDVLRHVRAPIGVVSVCGRARQGKSYILNQLLGRSSGFTVAPTLRPCTKGLWMWSAPVERTSPDGEKYYLVMLDTEGIDAWDQTGQYSVQIFSLAVLLSSLFVYNQMGGIDEAALDRLSLVTEMTKHIRVRASASDQTSNRELSEFTPSFLWLLRDFYLDMEEDGHAVTPGEYLETALSAVPANSAGARAKNQIRESIKSLFPDRDCFALVRPMSDEKKLQRLETVPAAQLRPEFREGLAHLMDICFERAKPKRIANTTLNGPMLAAMVEQYVEAINNGAVPTIATAWQGVAEMECRRAADEAEATYHRTFKDDVMPESAALLAEHQRALAAAKAHYDKEAVGEASIKAAHGQKWQAAVERSFAQVRDRRLAEASQQVEALINTMTTRLHALTVSPSTSAADISGALDGILKEYAATAVGPTKWERLAQFLRQALGTLVQRAEASAATREAAAREAASKAEAAAAAAAAEVTRLRTAAGSEESKARALEAQLEATHRSAQQEIQKETQRLQAVHAAGEKALQSEVEQARQHASQAEAAHQEAARALDAQVKVVESLRRQLADAIANADQARSGRVEMTSQMQALRTQHESELAALRTELAQERAHVSQLQAERAAQQQQLTQLQQDAERQIAELAQRSQAAGAEPNAAADAHMDDGGNNEQEPANNLALAIEQMTIQEIKELLTDNGHEGPVWELANRKQPRVKKADWVRLARETMGAY